MERERVCFPDDAQNTAALTAGFGQGQMVRALSLELTKSSCDFASSSVKYVLWFCSLGAWQRLDKATLNAEQEGHFAMTQTHK